VNESESGSYGGADTASASEADGSMADVADCSEPWPLENTFCLKDLNVLKQVRTRKREWLGVYEGMSLTFFQGTGSQDLLCASRSPSVLYRRLRKMSATFPLIVRRAPSKVGLPRKIEPAKPDRFAQLRRSAFEAVGEARRMLDPDSFSLPFVPLKDPSWFVYELLSFDRLIVQAEAKSLYGALNELSGILLTIEERCGNRNLMRAHEYSDLSAEFAAALRLARGENKFRVANAEAQRRIDKFLAKSEEIVATRFEKMRQASDFLHTIANMSRSKGAKVGDRATGTETRKALTVLHRLAQDEPLKSIAQVAIDGRVDDAKTLRNYKSLERLVSRFSKRLARAVYDEYSPRIESLDYNHLFHALRDWPWIDRRRDRLALMEAARRGLPRLRLI
jgi:hypothetical protein